MNKNSEWKSSERTWRAQIFFLGFQYSETVFRLELIKILNNEEVAVKSALKCIAWYYCGAGSSSATQTPRFETEGAFLLSELLISYGVNTHNLV